MRAAASALLLVALVLGCAKEKPAATAALAAAVTAPPVEVADNTAAGVVTAEEAVLDAGALRLVLEQLLGEHVLLIAGAATDHAQGMPTGQALGVVEDNTRALSDAIALVYGDVGGRAFASLWSQHVAFFLDHARGTAEGDRLAVREADEHLEHYEQGFGSFTATATGGALPAEAVAQLLSVHVADINGYVAARLAQDGEAAATTLGAGHDDAADIGAALAAAIAGQGPTAFPGDPAEQRTEVAAELARAFADHLAVRASGAEDAPDAAAATRRRLDAAVRAAATDPSVASAGLERLTTPPVGTRADAEALATALGVPEMGAQLVAIVTAPPGDPTAPEVIDAHRAGYELAAAWLG
jgi:hypothetical protein